MDTHLSFISVAVVTHSDKSYLEEKGFISVLGSRLPFIATGESQGQERLRQLISSHTQSGAERERERDACSRAVLTHSRLSLFSHSPEPQPGKGAAHSDVPRRLTVKTLPDQTDTPTGKTRPQANLRRRSPSEPLFPGDSSCAKLSTKTNLNSGRGRTHLDPDLSPVELRVLNNSSLCNCWFSGWQFNSQSPFGHFYGLSPVLLLLTCLGSAAAGRP